MAYTTANLQSIIAGLEASLGGGVKEIRFEGKHLVYDTNTEKLNAIAYFKALLPTATDAPVNPTPKTRTFFLFGSKGIGI